jgi:hypothetical protein
MPKHISDNHFSILKNSFLSSSEFKVSVNPFQDSISYVSFFSSGNILICLKHYWFSVRLIRVLYLVSTGVLLSWIPQEIQNTPL